MLTVVHEETHREQSCNTSENLPPISVPPGRSSHLRLIKSKRDLPKVLCHRDPDAVRQAFPWVEAMADHYFRAEVEGTEYLSNKASITVSTHNGGMAMPDLYCLYVAFFRRFGLDTAVYGMAHKVVFRIPILGPKLKRFGAIPASQENAKLVLGEDMPLFVCPGGDEDNLKPWSQRHRIRFGERRGFIRLAIREQVPIIPVVSVGAHETMMVLNDGRKLAHWLGMDKFFRVKTAPFTLGFPNGLAIAGLGSIPLPSKIKIKILPPIFLPEAPSAAEDANRVEKCFNHVRLLMQRALTGLASQRRRPLLG